MLPANFNQLYYFWVIAKAGSISAAAKQLFLNQSTLSLQMKQLETALGKPLLTRSRRGVGLTQEGRLAFEYCERIFVQAEELVALLREGRPGPATFRLGVSQTISWQKALEVINHLESFGDAVSVRIQTRSSEELQERLERQMLDMIVSDLDLSVRMGKNFQSRLVSSTELYFLGRANLKKKMRVFPSGLGKIPLLLLSPSNPIRIEADHYLRRNGITANVQAEIENPDIIRILAVQGAGAALMDTAAAGMDLKQGRLVKLHKNPIGIREKLWFICGRQQKSQPLTQKILDGLMDSFSFQTAEKTLIGAAR